MTGKDLKRIYDLSGIKGDDFAKKVGTTRGTLYLWFEKSEIDSDVEKLINSDKDLKKIRQLLIFESDSEKTNVKKGEKLIPYYDVDATAGNVTIFENDGKEYIKEYISASAFSDCEMFINVSGSSMYPKYCSGEQIALKRLLDFEVVAYGEAYLIVTREQRLLKYIDKSTQKNMWTLRSEHKDYGSFDIHIAKVLHLYIVKGKITKNVI